MRSAASALLVILALVAAAVAGPALWIQQNVVDEAGFATLAGPLGENKAFQEGLSAIAAEQATASLSLPPQLENLAATVIQNAARSIYSDPGYAQAWTETLERSHQLSFQAAGNPEIEGDLLIDIAPLIGLIAAKVGGDVGITLPTPDTVVITTEQPNVARLLPAVTTLGGLSGWLVAIAVVLLAAGILSARRRPQTVLLAAVGLALVALLWLLGSSYVEGVLAGLVMGSAAAQQIGVELGGLARTSWRGGIAATFALAALLAVGGVGALMMRRKYTP